MHTIEKKTCRIIFLVLFTFSGTHASSQHLLFQKNRYKQAFYEVGDRITFRIKGDREKISGTITGFEDSSIVFVDAKYNPKNISALYVDDKIKSWFILRYKYQPLFLLAGSGYLLVSFLNTFRLTRQTLVISGSLITAGLIAKYVVPKKITIKGRRKLMVV